MEYCEMELLSGVKYVGLGKYVKVGIYTILSGTLGAVETGVKLVSPLGTVCTRFLDITQGLLQPLLWSRVVALSLGSHSHRRMNLVLEPGEDSFHINRLLMRWGCGAVRVVLGFGVLAATDQASQAH